MPVTIKTVVFNAVLGLAAGFATLPLLGNAGMCCCGGGLVPVVAALLGSFLAFLLFDPASPPRNALFSGVLHGILVGVLAVVAVGFGLMFLTQDQTVIRKTSEIYDQVQRLQKTYAEELEKEAGSEKLSEEEREKLRKDLESFRSETADQDAMFEKFKKNPAQIRSSVLTVLLFYNLVATALAGLLGGLLGKKLFRSRFQSSPGVTGGGPDQGDAGPADSDDARMKMPEQPPGWWEKK
jgi:uncharacterized membrane protein